MSFILDALRKSESERRREATPGLVQIPPAKAQSHAPRWVWIVMSVLVVGMLALTAGWWQSTQTARDDREASTPVVEPLAAAAEPSGGVELGASPAPSVAPPRAQEPASIPTLAEVRASGLSLPELSLQLISYSEDEAQRFVFINGFRYRQGQRVQNGPLVVSIAPDSVVLEQQGRDFRLTPE